MLTRDCRLKGNLGVPVKVQPPPHAETQTALSPLSMSSLPFTTDRNKMLLNSYLKLSLLDTGLGRHLLNTTVHPTSQLLVSSKFLQIGIFKKYFYFKTITRKNKQKQPTNQNTQYVGFFTVSFSKCTSYTCPDGLLHFLCLSTAY